MADVVDLKAFRQTSADVQAVERCDNADNDRFLIEEGLELLAAYRMIDNREIRKSLLDFVKMFGAGDRCD